MLQPTLDLCAAAGLSFETTERALLVPCANAPVDLLLVRPHDIPEYVQDGVVDAGITGANLVVESEADVDTLAELGFARCTLEAAVPVDAPQAGARRPRRPPRRDRLSDVDASAASTGSASRRSSSRSPGSVEAAPRLGLADAIVDLVSTGSTASANGLRRIGRLLDSQAVLLRGREPDGEQGRARRAARADAARRRRRAPPPLRDDERAGGGAATTIRAVLPSMGAPSVLELAEPGQIAIHAAVEADRGLGPARRRSRPPGATSILVVPVERLVP